MDFRSIICAVVMLQLTLGQEDAPAAANPQFEVEIYPMKSEIELDEGDSKILSCKASLDDPAALTFTWKQGETIIDVTTPGARKHVRKSGDLYQLAIDPVQKEDAGQYKCEATDAQGGTAEATVSIEVMVAVTVQSDEDQFGILGQTKTLECKHTGNPKPTLTWVYADGSQVPKDGRFSWNKDGDTLEIKDLESADKREYTCELFVLTSGANVKHTINFDVVELPVISSVTMMPTYALVGATDLKITCAASGTPAPTYSFTKDGAPVTEGVSGGELTIATVTEADQAVYTCLATNKGGEVNDTLDLDVLVPPTIDEIEKTQKAKAGDSFQLDCVVRGDPEPSVVWSKEGEANDGSWNQTSSTEGADKEVRTVTKTLVIAEVTHKHAGSYKCTATVSQPEETVETTVELEVEYKPTFDTEVNKQTVFWGWEGHTATLTCQVQANPVVSEIKWFKNVQDAEEEVTQDDTYTIDFVHNEGHLSTSTLTFTVGADDSMYTTYACEAKNLHNLDDPARRVVNLTQAFAPGKPTLQQIEINAMSAKIQAAKPQSTGGQEVTAFEFQSKTDSGDASGASRVDAAAGDAETLIEVTALTPGTSYVVEVRAINAVGAGEWESMSVTTKNNSKPERMIVVSDRNGEKQTEYEVEWEEIKDGGSEVKHVTIMWSEVTLNDKEEVDKVKGETSEHTIDAKDLNIRKFVITDLKPGTDYQVRLKATNAIGDSDENLLIIKTAAKPQKNTGTSSASLGSGGIIAIILTLIVIVAIVVIAIFIIARRKPELLGKLRKGGARGEEEGVKEGGKDPAEEEKLIQKEDTAKVENEVDPAPVVEPKEFEPETKPDSVPAVVVDVQEEVTEEAPATEPTEVTAVTPGSPDKPEAPGNPTA